jgi:hypothetical protein
VAARRARSGRAGALGAALLLAAACSQVLGFKDPTLDEGAPTVDAAAPADGSQSSCAACRFGCDPSTGACRPERLWIFKTPGATLANDFGGADQPPNVRGGADARCLAAYSASYASRQCSPAHVRAVLHVSSVDSIAGMAARYAIPVDVPVHRADDNARVTASWGALIDPTRVLDVPATTAATDAVGVVWSGSPAASCQNWTSALGTDTGTRAFTTRTDATWLSQDTFRCDRLAGLLCICWPGGG